MKDLEKKLADNRDAYEHHCHTHNALGVKYKSLMTEADQVQGQITTAQENLTKIELKQQLLFKEIVGYFCQTLESFAVYDEKSVLLQDGATQAVDVARIARYNAAKDDDPEMAALIEPLYLESKEREDLRNGKPARFDDSPLAGMIVVPNAGGAELYASIPHSNQNEGLASYLTSTVMDALILTSMRVASDEDYAGLLHLSLSGEQNELVESLRVLKPHGFDKLNIHYRVFEMVGLSEQPSLEEIEGNPGGGKPVAGEQGVEDLVQGELAVDEAGVPAVGKSTDEVTDDALSGGEPLVYVLLTDAAQLLGLDRNSIRRYLDTRNGPLKSMVGSFQGQRQQRRYIESGSLEEFMQNQGLEVPDFSKYLNYGSSEGTEASVDFSREFLTPAEAAEFTGLSSRTLQKNYSAKGGLIKTKMEQEHGTRRVYLEKESLEDFIAAREAGNLPAKPTTQPKSKPVPKSTPGRTSHAEIPTYENVNLADIFPNGFIQKTKSQGVTGYDHGLIGYHLGQGNLEHEVVGSFEHLKLDSLVPWLEQRYGKPLEMYTVNGAASAWAERENEEFENPRRFSKVLQSLRSRVGQKTVAVVRDEGKNRYLSNYELDRYLLGYFARRKINSWQDDEIPAEHVMDMLQITGPNLKSMSRPDSDQGLIRADGTGTIVTSSVKSFLSRYFWTGTKWRKHRYIRNS